jgi:hypothetical protein
MAGIQDYWDFCEDFQGHLLFSSTAASNTGHRFVIADTSTAGTPTYTTVDGSSSGEVALDFDSQEEIQNVCLYQADVLNMDIDKIRGVEFRVKQNQATIDAASSIAFGLAGDRNAAIDSIAQAALFRCIGSNAVVVETDDGTTNNDDVATGESLTNAYKTFKIDFSQGKSDVRFFMTGSTLGSTGLKAVATGTTFDMSAYTGSLQLFAQIQKTSDTNTDGITIDYIKAWGIR